MCRVLRQRRRVQCFAHKVFDALLTGNETDVGSDPVSLERTSRSYVRSDLAKRQCDLGVVVVVLTLADFVANLREGYEEAKIHGEDPAGGTS